MATERAPRAARPQRVAKVGAEESHICTSSNLSLSQADLQPHVVLNGLELALLLRELALDRGELVVLLLERHAEGSILCQG